MSNFVAKSWFALALSVTLYASAMGQGRYPMVHIPQNAYAGDGMMPFDAVYYDHDWQPFAAASNIHMDDGQRPNEGVFFRYNRIYSSMTKPNRQAVGADLGGVLAGNNDGIFNQFNSLGASIPESSSGWGNRFEAGYLVDQDGWMISVVDGPGYHDQWVHGANDGGAADVSVLFTDPFNLLLGYIDRDGDGFDDDLDNDLIFGRDGLDQLDGNGDPGSDGVPETFVPFDDLDDLIRIATTFDQITVDSQTHFSGVEITKVRRKKRTHGGSYVEVFLSARYFELDDHFNVTALGGGLGDAFWNTRAINSLVGPQVGFRWSHKRGRWTWASEGRFLAAANFTRLRQDGELGTLLTTGAAGSPLNLTPQSFWNTRSFERFSPMGEVRAEMSYQVTKAFSLNAGYTGYFIGNIARASTNVIYSLPTMGLGSDTEEAFANGVHFGFEFNR